MKDGAKDAPSRAALLEAAWRYGELRGLAVGGAPLHEGQRALLDKFYASQSRLFAVLTSRRWGKSIWAVTLAAEHARRGKRVLLAADSQKHIRTIVQPHMNDLLSTCPAKYRPTWNVADSAYHWPGGGIIRLVGLDQGQADKARGTAEDLVVIDEAGFVDELEYVINSIALPQLLTTGGRIAAISTPSVNAGHYLRRFCEQAERAGAFHRQTIYDAPHLSHKLIENYKADYEERYGPDSSHWLREYMCEWVADAEKAVIPEWDRHKGKVIRPVVRPEYKVDNYVAIDVGHNDLTVALFGFWDYPARRLCIEYEAVIERATTPDIERIVHEGEKLWDSPPRLRVVDAPPIVRAQLVRAGLSVQGVQKRKSADRAFKVAALDSLRTAIQDGAIQIDPRCRTTVAHVGWATWNATRTDWERPPESHFADGTLTGHFDALDALIYANWSVHKNHDPRPLLPGHVTEENYLIREPKRRDFLREQKMLRAFTTKKARRR